MATTQISELLKRLEEHYAGHYDHVVDPSSFLTISEGSTLYASCSRPLASTVLYRIADTLVFTTIDAHSMFREVWHEVHYSSHAALSEITEYPVTDVGSLISILRELQDDITSVRIFHPVMTGKEPYVLRPDLAGTSEKVLYDPYNLNGPVKVSYKQIGYKRGESPVYMICPIHDLWTGGVSLETIEHNCDTTECLITPVEAFDPNDTATVVSLDEMDLGTNYQIREAVRQLAAQFITHILAGYVKKETFKQRCEAKDAGGFRFTEVPSRDGLITSGYMFLIRALGPAVPVLTSLDSFLAFYCHLIYQAAHSRMGWATPTYRPNSFRMLGYYRPWFGWGFQPTKFTAFHDEPWSSSVLKCLGIIDGSRTGRFE